MSGRCWKWDTYNLRKHPDWSIASVLDIGANNGSVSLMCRILFPIAKIIAIEPCKEVYDKSKEAVSSWGIKYYNFALGNGEKLYFSKRRTDGWNRFQLESEKSPKLDSYTVDSYTLPQLCKMFKLIKERPHILKIDCEGGERFLLNDNKSVDCIRNSLVTLMELHFGFGGKREQWQEYFNKLSSTHDLLLCNWYRTEVRRHYIYKKIDYLPDFGRLQIQLLSKDWKERQNEVWWIKKEKRINVCSS